MPGYEVYLSEDADDFLSSVDAKSQRICKNNLKKLKSDPYPGRGSGDKEKIIVEGEEVYRLHIGRSYTAFYVIVEKDNVVRVLEIMTIDEAHKKYGY
ncbi:MAG: type II toxin-antitoxin system RelE family toxin [Candidatus Aenigmatarchaeota archaeon]